MSTESSRVPSVEHLRAAALVHGVAPTDDDLEAVQGFLATILPVLAEIEGRSGPDVPPAGLYLPDPEGR
jgi:hypothetical protein